MKFLKKALTVALILSILGFYFPRIALVGQGQSAANAATTEGITEHTPVILAPPEEHIPVEKVAKKKTSVWVWIGVAAGVVLVGALAAGGGGGGGGGGDGDGGGGTGSVTIGW
jgi:hypothetical protein